MLSISSLDKVACICEGTAEETIINILLKNNSLIFTKSQLIDDEILPRACRKPKQFCQRYLTRSYDGEKISIVYIVDSEQNYPIPEAYSWQIAGKHITVTKPEIEMLMIHSKKWYREYKKVNGKPSIFLATKMGIGVKKIKTAAYVCEFFEKNDLIYAIKEHRRVSSNLKKGVFLADLLR